MKSWRLILDRAHLLLNSEINDPETRAQEQADNRFKSGKSQSGDLLCARRITIERDRDTDLALGKESHITTMVNDNI